MKNTSTGQSKAIHHWARGRVGPVRTPLTLRMDQHVGKAPLLANGIPKMGAPKIKKLKKNQSIFNNF